MTCPVCGEATIVVDSRSDCESVYRRRKCKVCDHVFHTTELESDGTDYNRVCREIAKDRYWKQIEREPRPIGTLRNTVNLLERKKHYD